MKVKLLEHSSVRTMLTGRNTCYSKATPDYIYDNLQLDKTKMLETLNSGHLSIAEHINFTFSIVGISRACSHQLVRHRHASYSQKSQRYITYNDKFQYITPKAIEDNTVLNNKYDRLMSDIQKFYSDAISEGIKAEDARMVLPNACTTDLTMTLNFRELMHIANERLCNKAQGEINDLVRAMVSEVLAIEEFAFLQELLVPKCGKLGYCPENVSCKGVNR